MEPGATCCSWVDSNGPRTLSPFLQKCRRRDWVLAPHADYDTAFEGPLFRRKQCCEDIRDNGCAGSCCLGQDTTRMGIQRTTENQGPVYLGEGTRDRRFCEVGDFYIARIFCELVHVAGWKWLCECKVIAFVSTLTLSKRNYALQLHVRRQCRLVPEPRRAPSPCHF